MADREARIIKRKEFEGRMALKAFTLAQNYLTKKDPVSAEAAGEKLGLAIYKMARSRRERAQSNLELAMPELSTEARATMVRDVFRHYGKVTADFLTSAERPVEDLIREMEVEGEQYVKQAYANGNGVMMVGAHLGNHERLPLWLSGSGYRMTGVVRDVRNPELNQKVNAIRARSGTIIVPRGGAARVFLETLKRNELIGMLPDQSDDEVYVPFFGKPAGTAKGVGVLQARTNATILPSVCYHVGPGKYLIRFHPPTEPLPGYAKAEDMTAAVTAKIEEMIRVMPEQWLWFHDRWKSARKRGLL
jgi:KDO2-lipid IV(A) lauroyltransferase